MPIYYEHLYSSYERGLNKKQNFLINRFFPKGRSLEDVSLETPSGMLILTLSFTLLYLISQFRGDFNCSITSL